MSYERYYQTMRKLYPGTIGGQSRVATPVSQLLLSGASASSEEPPLPPP